jgi:hypothetical protein
MRATANRVHGLGHVDSTGSYEYQRARAKEGVYVVNDDTLGGDIPAFGVMLAMRLANIGDPTGKRERDVYRAARVYHAGPVSGAIEDGVDLLVNGSKDIPLGKVGIAYPITDLYPRQALWDKDQFPVAWSGDAAGPLPYGSLYQEGSWKLGPGLPGFQVVKYEASFSDNTVLVIADKLRKTYWGRVHSIPVQAHAVIDVSADELYDGSSFNPEISFSIMVPDDDPGNAGAFSIAIGEDFLYTIGTSSLGLYGGRAAAVVQPGFEDPLTCGKLWPTSRIGTPPTGWSSAGTTLGSYTVIKRDS